MLAWAQVDAETPVAIYAEGKEHAMAVGWTKMSTQEMREARRTRDGRPTGTQQRCRTSYCSSTAL